METVTTPPIKQKQNAQKKVQTETKAKAKKVVHNLWDNNDHRLEYVNYAYSL